MSLQYTGPPDKKSYLAWLFNTFGEVSKRLPLGSIINLNDIDHVVVGYCEIDGQPGVNLTDIADCGTYDNMIAKSFPVCNHIYEKFIIIDHHPSFNTKPE